MSRPPVGVVIEGDARLRRTLRAAGQDLEDLSDAHREAGPIAASGARQRAPRRTGFLASSIRAGTEADAAVVSVGAVYGGVINYGWAARGISAQPFATQGVEATEPAWLGSYTDAIETALRKVKGA